MYDTPSASWDCGGAGEMRLGIYHGVVAIKLDILQDLKEVNG